MLLQIREGKTQLKDTKKGTRYKEGPRIKVEESQRRKKVVQECVNNTLLHFAQ